MYMLPNGPARFVLPHRHLSPEERVLLITNARLRIQRAKIALDQAEAHERFIVSVVELQQQQLRRTRVGTLWDSRGVYL